MDIHVVDFGRRIRIRTAGGHAPVCGAPDVADEWSAGEFVRRHFRDAFEIGRLRVALSPGVYDVTRWPDEEVVREAARRLASGAWRIASQELQAGGAGAPPPQEPGTGVRQEPPAPARAPASSPQRARAPAPPSAAPAPAQSTAPVAEQDWLAQVDQVRQAATLETAAQRRSPFCAICQLLSGAPGDKENNE